MGSSSYVSIRGFSIFKQQQRMILKGIARNMNVNSYLPLRCNRQKRPVRIAPAHCYCYRQTAFLHWGSGPHPRWHLYREALNTATCTPLGEVLFSATSSCNLVSAFEGRT